MLNVFDRFCTAQASALALVRIGDGGKRSAVVPGRLPTTPALVLTLTLALAACASGPSAPRAHVAAPLLAATVGAPTARPAATSRTAADAVARDRGVAGSADLEADLPLRPLPALTATLAVELGQLQRLSFGVNGSLLTAAEAQGGVDAWLDHQLHPGPDDGLPVEVSQRLQGMRIRQEPLEPLVLGIERQRREAKALSRDSERKAVLDHLRETANQIGREAQLELLWRETYSTWQVQELLTAFWCNHFSIFLSKGDVPLVAADYVDHAIRPHVLGHFTELLRATARHPAMLRYLDNERNAAGHLNENFARELLELHTLGVDGGYTQKDVQELARTLTGFGVYVGNDTNRAARPGTDGWRRDALFEYNPARHDFGEKTVLGERVHARGYGEFEEVLNRLARHPATIHHVSVQLATFLLGEAPPADLLEQMRATWVETDGDLRRLTLVVVHSPAFQASLMRGFKSPQRYVVGGLRLAYEDRPVLNMQPALNWLNRMQHAPLARVTPDGYPLLSAGWTAPGQFATRFDIARQLGFGSAGLFRPEGSKGEEQAAFPQLATAFYYRALEPGLSMGTRQSLAHARSPQEWSLLLLSSPEMMRY